MFTNNYGPSQICFINLNSLLPTTPTGGGGDGGWSTGVCTAHRAGERVSAKSQFSSDSHATTAHLIARTWRRLRIWYLLSPRR